MTFCFPCFVDRKVVFFFSCTVNACISQFQVRPEPPTPSPPSITIFWPWMENSWGGDF